MQLIIKLAYKIASTLFTHRKPKSSWLKRLPSAVRIFSFCSASPQCFPVQSCSALVFKTLPKADHGTKYGQPCYYDFCFFQSSTVSLSRTAGTVYGYSIDTVYTIYSVSSTAQIVLVNKFEVSFMLPSPKALLKRLNAIFKDGLRNGKLKD